MKPDWYVGPDDIDDDEYIPVEQAAREAGFPVDVFVNIMILSGVISTDGKQVLRPDLVKRLSDPPSTMRNN